MRTQLMQGLCASRARTHALKAVWASRSHLDRGLMASRRALVAILAAFFARRTNLTAHNGPQTRCNVVRGENGLPQTVQAGISRLMA
jgi:hypothetical protein